MKNANEIKKALEQRIKDLPCIHEKYEPTCGMWCEHLHIWCVDFNNKSLKENCSEYKPCCSMSLEKQVLDLINQYEAEIERLEESKNACKDIVDTCENGAREEFAERLKDKFPNNSHWVRPREMVDNLLKEMGIK